MKKIVTIVALSSLLSSCTLFPDNNYSKKELNIIDVSPTNKQIMHYLDSLATCEVNADNKFCAEVIESKIGCYGRTVEFIAWRTFGVGDSQATFPEINTNIYQIDCPKELD
jgi:hypothetical protein